MPPRWTRSSSRTPCPPCSNTRRTSPRPASTSATSPPPTSPPRSAECRKAERILRASAPPRRCLGPARLPVLAPHAVRAAGLGQALMVHPAGIGEADGVVGYVAEAGAPPAGPPPPP